MVGWIIWCIGWIYTGELDDKKYGVWSGFRLFFLWPERLAQIHKEKKGQSHE